MAIPYTFTPIGEEVTHLEQMQANLASTLQSIDASKQLQQLRGVQIADALQRQRQRQVTQQLFAESLAGQSGVPDPSLVPNEDDSPVTTAQKQAKRLIAQAALWEQSSNKIVAGGGDPNFAQKLKQDALSAQYRAKQLMSEARLEQRDQAKQIANIAGTAKDEASFQTARQQMAALDPKFDSRYAFDRGEDGQPVWGPVTQRTMDTLFNSSMTAKDAFDLKIKQDDAESKEGLRQAQIERETAQAEAQRALERDRDSHAVLNRERAEQVRKGKPAKVVVAKEPKAPKTPDDVKVLQREAAKAPTKGMVDAARGTVKTAYPDEKFDNASLDTLAADLASRATQLRAEAASRGEPIGLDEARQQALEQLRPFIKKEVVKEGFLGFNKEERMAYRRAGQPQKPAEAKPTEPAVPKGVVQSLPDPGSVPPGTRARNTETGKIMTSDGKRWY